MAKTKVFRCEFCGASLKVETTPASGGIPAMGPLDKVLALRALLVLSLNELDAGGLVMAVHTVITAAGMAQAEIPAVAVHDCPGFYANPEGTAS